MKKHLLSLLLVLGLFIACAPGSRAYVDVPAKHWAAADIQAAKDAGILTGIGTDSFGLGRTMNRAGFVTALVRLFGWETVAPTGREFTDVGESNWFSAAVETAVKNGALPTYTGTFRPYDPITREEMVTMLVRGLGYNALAAAQAEHCPFSDVATNRGYIALAADLSLVDGYPGNVFKPHQAATREQAAAVLMRLYRRLSSSSAQIADTTGHTVITIPTPKATTATAVPSTPLEPIASLYTALQERKNDGADMSRVVLVFSNGGWETVTRGENIVSSSEVSAEKVEEYLSRGDVTTYYAEQYESGYLTFRKGIETVTVWYQSEESLHAKLQLARLFGVTLYIC